MTNGAGPAVRCPSFFAVQDDNQKCADRTEEEGSKPPTQTATPFCLGEAGVDQRQRKPADGVFT